MDRGDAKVKTMAKSVLPSRRRKGAREDKRLAHRQHRRQVSERLGQLRWCDYDDFVVSVTHHNNRRIEEIKWERRAADNVSAVVRWAEALTKDIPRGERVAFMKRLLPDNLIGRHALTHLYFLDKDFDYPRWKVDHADARRRRVADLTHLVGELLHLGAHAEINISVRRAHKAGHHRNGYDRSSKKRIDWVETKDCCAAPVVLAGSHDIDNFVDRLTHTEHHEWADSVTRLAERLGLPGRPSIRN